MKLNIISLNKFKEMFFYFLKYVKNVDDDVNTFWHFNKHKIKKFYLQQKRDSDVIISASSEWLLKPICDELNINLIGSLVDKYTGKTLGKNCKGFEKVVRYNELFDEEINEFYSDSYSDTPLAKIAKKAFIVNKNIISEWNF